VLELIFVPGFSTAEAITNVSGRGVGMDVVKTNIERIGGTVGFSPPPSCVSVGISCRSSICTTRCSSPGTAKTMW
jgi:two-component system, chemotaxis family, sensor kinase CheA